MAFICPDTEDAKKTSFRLTDVASGGEISIGDEVEYVLIQSRPNSKPIATNVRKIRLTIYVCFKLQLSCVWDIDTVVIIR